MRILLLYFTIVICFIKGVFVMTIETFRYDGEEHMYQFEIRYPSSETAESQFINQNCFGIPMNVK